jgi:hypothetical protein
MTATVVQRNLKYKIKGQGPKSKVLVKQFVLRAQGFDYQVDCKCP